jgi:outer membrane receptor for ferrienterochelin and colicins
MFVKVILDFNPTNSYLKWMGFFIFIIMFSAPTFSQSGYIEVKEVDTGLVIPEVSIIFTEVDSNQKQYASTNIQGVVANTARYKSKLEISRTGFKTIIDIIYPKDSKIYYLETDVFNLDQVIVTATRTQKLLKNAPVLTQIITGKQIESRGLQNVQDILSVNIPSIEFNKVGFGNTMSAQGLGAKNILILIDGERMAGETGSNVDYERLNTQEIEHIEIIKGATSTLYGSQAMGAVVNIITKKSKKSVYGSVALQYTSPFDSNYPNTSTNSDNYDIKKNLDKPNLTQNYTIGLNRGKWSSKTNFIQKSSDAYQLYDSSSIVKDYIEIDTLINQGKDFSPSNINGSKDYTITQSIGYKPNNKLELNVTGSYYQHEVFDFLFDNKHDQYKDIDYTVKTIYKPDNGSNYTLSYHDDIYNKYDYLEKLDEKKSKYRHHISNPKFIGIKQFNENQEITGGIEYLNESLLSKFFVQNELVTKSVSNGVLFLQDDISFLKEWNLVVGLRSDYHTSFGLHLTPKVSVMYKNYPLTIRANYAAGYRSPNLKELYMDWDMIGLFTIKGNSDLKPETNQYISTSIEYSNPKVNTSISIYRNAFNDKIEGLWFENQTIYQYHNTNNTKLYGLDYLLQYHPIKSLHIKAAYSYVNESREEGVRISSISPHTASFQIGYKYHKNNYKLNASLTGKYIGAKDFNVLDELVYQNEIVVANYPIHYDGYSTWRLAINQKYKDYGNLTLGVNNLLDYQAEIITFDTFTNPGRSYFAGFKLNIEPFFN